jgi:uncharacterized membrane protein
VFPLADAQSWWLFAGKFHPMVVHFPIALLLVAAGAEFLRLRRGGWRPGRTAVVCLAIGAPAAVFAAVLGWSDAQTAGHQGSTAWVLAVHRWLGVGTAAAGLLALGAALASRAGQSRVAFAWYRFGVILSAALVGATGHFGGALIYGPTYIQDSWAKAMRGAGAPVSVELASIDFARDVQPILARRCYQCHAGKSPEGGLLLDSREAAIKGGKSGRPAIVPGDAAASELISLVKGRDASRMMPPKGGSLEPGQVAVLEKWIASGAKWSGDSGLAWHWSYRPPSRPPVPKVADAAWVRNEIDAFILAGLEAEGVGPSPEADRPTLIRRVSLDLTGLPPTPAELDEFLNDAAPGAYERLVDRLLASPRYGERMALKWLDLARYADTNGYEKDDRRTMWPYRDWVIDAFNRDLPYDRFSVEQLAGDLLPSPSTDQLIATGFNRNTQINEEGGVDAEEFRVDAVIDRTNTFGSLWLGSTVGCAQCHDHKNDPLTQEEYFRLYAYFNGDDADVKLFSTGASAAGGMLPISKREDRAEYERLKVEVAELQGLIAAYPKQRLDEAQKEWERGPAMQEPAWTAPPVLRHESAAGAMLVMQPDGSLLATGASHDRDTYTIELPVGAGGATAVRLEVMPDPSTPGKGVGRSNHGNIVLQEVRAEVAVGGIYRPVVIPQALADFEQDNTYGAGRYWPIAAAIDGDANSGWAIGPRTKEPHTAVFRLAEAAPSGSVLRLTLTQNYGNFHTIGRLRVALTDHDDALAARPIAPKIGAILAIAVAGRTPEQAAALAEYFGMIAPALRPYRDRLGAARTRFAELTVAQAMVMKRAEAPRATHVMERGNFLTPGKAVEPGLPLAFGGAKRPAPRDRLGLAEWLFEEGNPLTARVAVNRLWEHHFGRGLVETSDDFGTQGDLPTHPELLDWLATELPQQGWSMKRMHRLIVTSAAYRQASNVTPAAMEKDAANKLVGRAPRMRVDAELVRDVALGAAGMLSAKMGGPSVFPPQPDGVWTMIYSDDKWAASTGEDRYRRGLYTFWRRTAPHPTMVSFDATSREVMCTRRARTNTPLQALATLNDPQFVEAAVGLGARALREGGPTDAERIGYAFRLCTSREPTAEEAARITALLASEREHYRANPAAAEDLLKSAPGVSRGDGAADELAAWSIVGNVLLNLDETITRP